ncbi:MAG: hypothetical protein R3B82_05285 [Sandaracinaceae bacterium]
MLVLGGCDELVGTDAGPGPGVDAGPGVDVDAGDIDGGGGGTDAGTDPGGLLVTGMGAEEIPFGSTYMQATLDGIPPYSDGVTRIQVQNVSGAALTVSRIDLTPLGETEPVEWTLNRPGTTGRDPIVVMDQALGVDEAFEFGLYFYPLASGPRNVRVDIRYGAGDVFTFTVAARGRDNATISPVVSNVFEHLLGRSNDSNSNSVQPGGIGADAAGNVYLDMNASGWDDRFNDNLVLARVNADGTLGWLRELQESYDQESRDIGDNGELGGGQDSLAVDGAGEVYVVAQRAASSTAAFQAFVISVGSDGSFRWATGVHTGPAEFPSIAADVLRGQSVDASLPDRVIVAGQIADSAGAFILALSKADGSLLWARATSLGGPHRVGSLTVDASGTAYIGGISTNAPFLARIDGVDGSDPSLAWYQRYAPGFANVHSIALDGDGVLAAIDVRGASTTFVGMRVRTSDGSVAWSRVWDAASATDNNNAITVALHEGTAVFSGRVAFAPFDTQGGEGFLLGLDPATGDYEWGSFYYTGKGAEERVSDYVTGLVSTSAGLWVLHQQTPGSLNMHHFWGRWYTANDDTLDFPAGDGSMRLADAGVTGGAETVTLGPLADAAAHPADLSAQWSDQTASVEFEDPVVTEAEMFRTGTSVLLQRVSVTP